MKTKQSGFFKTLQTTFGNTTPLGKFTQIAGAGSLLYVSYRDFKLMILGAKAGPGYYDDEGQFVAAAPWGMVSETATCRVA